jgi:hypothetical protein
MNDIRTFVAQGYEDEPACPARRICLRQQLVDEDLVRPIGAKVNYLCKFLRRSNRISMGRIARAIESANQHMLGRGLVWHRLFALRSCPPGGLIQLSCAPMSQKKGVSFRSCLGGEGRILIGGHDLGCYTPLVVLNREQRRPTLGSWGPGPDVGQYRPQGTGRGGRME